MNKKEMLDYEKEYGVKIENMSEDTDRLFDFYKTIYPVACKLIDAKLLTDNTLYVNVTDYQGGEFGCDRIGTLKDWAIQALEWAYSDDYEESDIIEIMEGFEQNTLIDCINEQWSLGIEELED